MRGLFVADGGVLGSAMEESRVGSAPGLALDELLLAIFLLPVDLLRVLSSVLGRRRNMRR
jgi:hypothetical protein